MIVRSFTLADAAGHLPRLRELMNAIFELRVQLKTMYQQLDELGHPPGETLPWGAPTAAINLHAVYAGMAEALREQVDAVRDTGAMIRDIEVGLIDWRAHVPSSPTALWWSWRFGERTIDHFRRAADEADRRPLSELPAGWLREALGRDADADADRDTDDVVAAAPAEQVTDDGALLS